jgi:TatD DNase family protein
LLVDTHCHLNFESFDLDRGAVIERALQAGVVRIVNPAVDLQTSKSAIALAESFEEVFAAVGIHPNELAEWDDESLSELSRLAEHPKVVAIGEIGLDYYRERSSREIQKSVFKAQLDLARKLNLPVIIHTRNASQEDGKAMDDALSILSDWIESLTECNSELKTRPGVLHSFSGDLRSANKAVQMNIYIGVGGPITFKKADTLREIVFSISIEHQLTETDAPFLTPHPYRGKRNEPAYVHYIAEKMSQVRGQTYDQVAEATYHNAKRLFNW